jgi:hypothetical protein
VRAVRMLSHPLSNLHKEAAAALGEIADRQRSFSSNGPRTIQIPMCASWCDGRSAAVKLPDIDCPAAGRCLFLRHQECVFPLPGRIVSMNL